MNQHNNIKHLINDQYIFEFLKYIESFFEDTLDIKKIDTNKPSEAVHAELVAIQRVTQSFQNLRDSINIIREEETPKKFTTFK